MTTTIDPISPAAAAVEAHHAQLRTRLTERTDALIDAVARHRPHEEPRRELVDFLRTDLLPHVEAEESLLYTAAAAAPIQLLARAMEDEHRMVRALIDEVAQTTDGMDAAAAASALVVLCDVRIEQEDRLLLPALTEAGVDLATVLGDHPEIVGPTGPTGGTP
ncbi:MAG TPA: hemerythrin domain-containing protein [Nocardioidaceae bacterium]|nr:hemerythrin domain-containing protein [Nocardioidaceae bacterium]